MENYVPSSEDLVVFEKMLTEMRIQKWINIDLFSPQWWLLLAVLIIPWFIWWKYVDRKRLTEILLFGLTTIIVTSYLDALLTELTFWSYKYKVVPLWPRLIPVDFTALPVIYMFIYQYFNKWRTFTIASLVMAAIFAFVGEPLLQLMDIYKLIKWKHIYSFPIYFVIAISLRWLVKKLFEKQASAN